MQIRRSGRDNAEGVKFSMAQWYPKLAEYDLQGWHPTPYVAREFYGIWGDFEVNITIDKNYVIGGTGYLQNPHDNWSWLRKIFKSPLQTNARQYPYMEVQGPQCA